MAIEALEGLTDEQLFSEANSDEAPADEVVAEPTGEVEEQTEQARDEAGRFAAQAADEPVRTEFKVDAEVGDRGDKPAVDDNAAMVPSWRVREINEEKRQIAEKYEAEKLQWQQERQRLAQPQPQPAKEPEKVAKPDPLLDPDGFEAYIEEKVEAKLLNDRREVSMANAHRAYKTEFEEAMTAATQQIDLALKARMQSSRDPGETLIQWHREQKTRAEVGNDPNAYFDKRLEAYLADTANQGKVLERIRGGVQQPQPGARPAVSIPPSLTRATSAATVTSADDDDVSNDGLWRHANA